MSGGRLSLNDRQQIAAGLAEGLSYSDIARNLQRPVSTITREISRNGGPSGYRAHQAHQATQRRARRRTTAPARPPSTPADTAHGRDPHAVLAFAERFTDLLAQTGLPPMMAKVLVCLYTTDSGGLTSAGLVQRLRVSPASISKAVGYLEEQQLIRRERHPRQRSEHYVIDGDVWYRAMIAAAQANGVIAEAAQQGADILGADTPAGTRLHDMGQFLRHVGEDLAQAAEHWRQIFSPSPASGPDDLERPADPA
ncbi:helix-turn-helix domain-containing protein [Actinomadura namibiensis]|uniref:DNA-binding transcriptional regulator GbsR (MarR family) n=1 Tax=Actinomadura namibiensis TaxID=182080 RepID=A0A7W3QSB9_ACTNM|nr:helix-turn-helix domain-containing protein [Actinomadura namibiensis]MBA8957477.1 DNA-binding transcriptional regulator GbsR (MarR family) [Actinomadura namibiensis]